MNIHRVIIKDEQGKPFSEARYSNGVLYKQNRSHDLEMSLDDFMDRLKTTKDLTARSKQGYSLEYSVINDNPKWVA